MNRTKAVVLGKLVLALTAAVTGCGRGDSDAESTKLTIKGSDTMVNLVNRWTEAYMDAHEEADLSVTGGGTGTGISAMLNGTTDLAMASREVKQKEIDAAREKGNEFKEIVVGLDGIALIVHPENPISELDLDQIRQIYNGTLTNWSEVGGPDQKITVLSRDNSSGTFVFFQEMVLKKEDYSNEALMMTATSTIVQSIAADKWNIGYIGLGYADKAQGKVKVLAIRTEPGSAAVTPSVATVQDKTYPIARPLYLYSFGEPMGIAKAFVDFALSADGQKIVEETGYVPLR